jgi:hypothetical protein
MQLKFLFFRDMELWVDNIIKIFRDNEICMLLINNFKKRKKEKKRGDVEICMFGHD